MPNSFFPRADPSIRARLDQDETVRLANTFDWGATELGPVPSWPEALRAAVRTIMVSEVPMVMLAGRRDGVLIYNSGYAAFAGDRHPALFGKPVLEAWPEIADFNRENLRRGFNGESWYLQDQELRLNRTGELESAWMNLHYSPVLDDDGTPLAVLVVVIETTDRVRASQALADSERRFRTLADTMPQIVWSTRADGYTDYYNARWYEFTGRPEGTSEGDAWADVVHPDDRDNTRAVWQLSLRTGEPYHVEYRLRRRDGEYRWVLGRALPIRNDQGQIVRWFGTCTDIHETKLLAEEREIVAQELSHRIKNIFSMITGLIGLTARSRPELAEVGEQLRDRIHALGRAHDFLRPHSPTSSAVPPASLHAFIHELLDPFASSVAGKIDVTGEDVPIDDGAATPLALLFHELATNSAKYGALLQPSGTVEIVSERLGQEVAVSWIERGAQLDAQKKPPGFGSKLIELSVTGQMRGSLEREWRSDGLSVHLKVPVDALSRSVALRPLRANRKA